MTLSVTMQHRFGGFSLDVAFEAPHGITVLFGRSGSGKTTIVNAIAGLMKPESGRIAIGDTALTDTANGIMVPVHKRRIGYVFQEGRLFPHLDVRQNLMYGQRFFSRRTDGESPDRVIGMLGLEPLLERRPGMLSGGEKQRVAIGRALLCNPQLILADEPLASLDEPRKADILPYLEMLRDEVSIPVVYVSHSAAEVARLATTVIALQDGRVLRQGPAADVLADPTIAPAGIRGVGAVLEARVVAHHPDGLTELDAGGVRLLLPAVAQAPGATIRIRIAAQEVILSREEPVGLSALNVLKGTIASVRQGDGPGTIVALQTPAGRVLARVTRRSAEALGLAEGVACHAIVKTLAIAPEDAG